MLGPAKRRALDQPVAVALDDLVPADHFYRHLDARLDLSFVRDWVRDAYPCLGRPSVDPVVAFKLYLVMVLEGIRSERQLLMLAADRLSVRWYLGYGLDEPLPDASTLTRRRQRLGLAIFRRFFEHVVGLCVEAGLVWGQELLADATRVPATAAKDSLVPRLRDVVDGQLVARFAGDEGPADRDADDTPGSVRWDLLEECRLDPQRPATGAYERISSRKISRTDPDATPMAMRDRRPVLGYQDHYLVDGGKARVILHALVTPGDVSESDVSESQVLLDQLRRTLFRRKLRPKRLIADAKYATGENIRALEEQGIRAYLPLPEWDKSSPYYHTAAFAYDGERGALAELQTLSSLPADHPKGKGDSTAELVAHPSGKFLYGSNRGHDSIAIFRVNPDSGRLTLVGHQAEKIKVPRNFAVDPTGRYLLAGSQAADAVVVFRIDQKSGELTRVGEPVAVPAPVCIRMMPAPAE